MESMSTLFNLIPNVRVLSEEQLHKLPQCDVCNKPVDFMMCELDDPQKSTYVAVVSCHGEVEKAELPKEWLFQMLPPLTLVFGKAFVKK